MILKDLMETTIDALLLYDWPTTYMKKESCSLTKVHVFSELDAFMASLN